MQLAKPKPVPFCFVVKRGSKIFPIDSSGIPTPVSIKSITAKLSIVDILIVSVPPLGIAWIEFIMILIKTASIFSKSQIILTLDLSILILTSSGTEILSIKLEIVSSIEH